MSGSVLNAHSMKDREPMSTMKMLGLAVAVMIGGQMAATVVAVEAAGLPALRGITDDASGGIDVHYRGRGYGGYGYGYGYGYGGYYAPPVYLYAGPPAVYNYSYSGSGSSYCARLRQRARETGSSALWRRYRREC